MIFTLTLYGYPLSEDKPGLLSTNPQGNFTCIDGTYTVNHDKVTCTVKDKAVSCGTDTNLNMKTLNIHFAPKSLDFKGNDICFVGIKGDIACGTQTSLTDDATFLVNKISGGSVTDIRFAVFWNFMCLRNSHSQVWCSQTDFSSNQKWTRMEKFKKVDKIRIENGEICGHEEENADKDTYQCLTIGTDDTKNEKTPFKFDPSVGELEPKETKF
eukprot:NODE_1069_length_2345_cov_0.491541.p1 type:complete len:213 gc:universal NODE_1069_length_2345_cov_0.491541:1577-939(-)